MAEISMRQLLETGVHFGHRSRRWNPKMKPYIFTERNGIHIIDLQQTVVQLEAACDLVRDTVARGGTVLFVGTKRQAQETVAQEAERCQMPYVNTRWLGGTLTNWRTIRERIDTLKTMERERDEGLWEKLTKKEGLMLQRKIDKLQLRLGGIREMKSVPDLVFLVDVNREDTAIHEANILEIPIIAIVDTNCDPDHIDYLIVGNDDAIRAIRLVTSIIADAVNEGHAMRKAYQEDEEQLEGDAAQRSGRGEDFEDVDDDDYLGEATLAKLRQSPDLFADKDDEDED
ncbi:MAG: 30S ribosomal protein S2 [Anaerolineae bacterium]|nr:30S ribosomal protein S2 [Anaerolineae bacterium]